MPIVNKVMVLPSSHKNIKQSAFYGFMDSDTHVVPFVGFSYINCIYFAWFSTAPCKPVFSAAVKIGFYKTINLKIA